MLCPRVHVISTSIPVLLEKPVAFLSDDDDVPSSGVVFTPELPKTGSKKLYVRFSGSLYLHIVSYLMVRMDECFFNLQ